MSDRGIDGLRRDLAASGHPLYLGGGDTGWVTAGPERAALILGPPRSGKTSALVVPAVLAASGPVVTTSTKPDVLAITAGERRRLGRCWLFDPSGTVTPPTGVERLQWSPVGAAATWDGAVLTAHHVVGAAAGARRDHWHERAEALLAPLLHAAALEHADMRAVMAWVNRHDAGPAASVLAELHRGTGLPADVLAGVMGTDERERSGIWSTAAGVLAAYRSEQVLASAERRTLDPADFVASSDTVYVVAPAQQQDLFAPLAVGLLGELRNAAYLARPAAADRPPLVLALDEVANISPLPDLSTTVAEGGSQGVLTLACLQDLSQARARWGPAADGWLSLFGTTVVLPGIRDVRTLEALSALAGEAEGATPGRRRAGRQSPGVRTRRRLPVDEISRGRPGMAVLLAPGAPPAWMRLTPYFAVEPFRALA